MSTPRPVRDRIASYRNRNAALRLPETRDLDKAIVGAVRHRMRKRGITSLAELDALPRGDELRLLVAAVIDILRSARFAVGETEEATDRLKRRLGIDSSDSSVPGNGM